MITVRNIYLLSVAVAIIAAFTSFFPNEIKAILFLIAIIMDSYVNKGSGNSTPLKLLFLFYIVSFFYVFVLQRGHFSELRNVLLSYPLMLMCFWIAPGLMKLNRKEAKFICYVFLICLIENLIVTAIIGRTSPWVIRYYFSGVEGDIDAVFAKAYSRQGLLSYQSAHQLSLLGCFLIVLFFEEKKSLRKILVLLIAFLSVYVMYLMTITTALLFGVLFMVAVAAFYSSNGNMKRFIFSFSTFAILVLATGGLTDLLQSSSKGGNYEISDKLNDVAETIKSGESQGQVAGRESMYDLTWNAIARNPILGGAEGPAGTGQHTLFFDYWAYYGVFSLLLFVGWWKEVKRMKKRLDRKKWVTYLLCLAPIVLLCFFKGPVFLQDYILSTIVVLRVGFISIEPEQKQPRISLK